MLAKLLLAASIFGLMVSTGFPLATTKFCASYSRSAKSGIHIDVNDGVLDVTNFATEMCVKGTDSCFSSWQYNSTSETVYNFKQGCWRDNKSHCQSNYCQLPSDPSSSKVEFCCCQGNICNNFFTKEQLIKGKQDQLGNAGNLEMKTKKNIADSFDDEHTYCAYHVSQSDIPSNISQDTLDGIVLTDGKTMRCKKKADSCFSLWYHGKNDTDPTIMQQGCWKGVHECDSETCQSNRPIKLLNQKDTMFCCCQGDMCNSNFSDIYDPLLHTTPDPLLPVSKLLDNSSYHKYRERTIVIALVSVCSVALLTIGLYLMYRIFLASHPEPSNSQCTVEDPSPPGFDISDLKLCEQISHGRYGNVWRGMMGDTTVAVKVFTANHRQFYQNEKYIYTLPFFEHENLLKFYGCDEQCLTDGSTQFILVLSYIPRGCLQHYLKTNIVDWGTFCKMNLSIARGLTYLHTDIRKGDQFKPSIAHRDINSRNILVNEDLSCVIGDFGFGLAMMGSKIIRNGHYENAEHSSLQDVGTLRYMAPELLDGAANLRESESSLKQIDVYAQGLVMWEISSRCKDLFKGVPTPEYMLPYQKEAGNHPSFEEMQILVARNKVRPKFPEVWKDYNQGKTARTCCGVTYRNLMAERYTKFRDYIHSSRESMGEKESNMDVLSGKGNLTTQVEIFLSTLHTHAIRALKETIEDCWDHDAEARLTAMCVEERIQDIMTLWLQEIRHKGLTPTITTTSNLFESQKSPDTQTVFSNGHIPTSQIANTQSDSSTAQLLVSSPPNGYINGDIVSQRPSSLHQDWSVSEQTTDTIIPLSPSENELPPPPTKLSNINMAKNLAMRPHQGRNPTVERNTHKRSDEELAVSGNTLVYGNEKPSSVQPTPTLASDSYDSFGDNLETSLVQNDVLSHHRSLPISYVQNQVNNVATPVIPKVANVPSSNPQAGSSRDPDLRAHKSKLTKFMGAKDLGSKLGQQLGLLTKFVSRGSDKHDGVRDSKESMAHVNTNFDDSNFTRGHSSRSSTSSVGSSHIVNGHSNLRENENSNQRDSGHGNISSYQGVTGVNGHHSDINVNNPIPTQVLLTNGKTYVRPANLNVNVSNLDDFNSTGCHSENCLNMAEVGVAKLEMTPHCSHQSVIKIRNSGKHSKSTSDLSPQKTMKSKRWSETGFADGKATKPRPSSLSLKGHNYTSRLGVSKTCTDLTWLLENTKVDKKEDDQRLKIKRRVKTPLSMKHGRFSLYDDRLMSDYHLGAKRSNSSLQELVCLDRNANSYAAIDNNC